MRTTLLLMAIILGPCVSDRPPVPLSYRAHCRTLWLFATPCVEVSAAILRQIQAFNPASGCSACHYTVVTVSPTDIRANHTSPDSLQMESIIFSFRPTMTGGCRVSAQSKSLDFIAVIDDGVNYCNLYNVLSASGLTSTTGFLEMTNEWACLGYGEADCST
ncbi:uncharacterized protein LOC144017075 [Festucalex cinctus]